MAKPQVLQTLQHGKLLTKSNFPQFVETFNYTVNRCQNFKGDGDVYRNGLIKVDNTNPEYPVIRLDTGLLYNGGADGPFAVNLQSLSNDNDEPITRAIFTNCVLRYGNDYYKNLDDGEEAPLSCDVKKGVDDVIYYVMSYLSDDIMEMAVSCNTADEVWDMLSADHSGDPCQYTLLYTVNDVNVLIDWRYEMNIENDNATPDADVPPEKYESLELNGLSSIQTKTRYNEEIENPELSDMITVMQLYNFDLSDAVSVQLSDQYNPPSLSDATDEEKLSAGYDFVIRKDNQIQYAKISVDVVPPDSSISAAELSSIQIRTVELEDGEDQKVLQLFQFELSDAITVKLGDQFNEPSPKSEEILSAGYDFIIRKDNKVKYAKLSIDMLTDTDVLSAQKSLEWKTTNDEENPQRYMQLYNMDEEGEEYLADLGLSGETNLLSDNYEFVVRKNGEGGEISYVSLSVSLSTLSNDISNVVSSIISSELSGLVVPPDADVPAAGLSSIQTRELDGGAKVLEFFKFDDPTKQNIDLQTDSQYDFVVRDNNAKRVKYGSLSSLSSSISSLIVRTVTTSEELSGLGVPPDADVPAAGLSSIQTRELPNNGGKVLELYKFDDPAVETVYLSAQNRYDFVMRDNVDHCIKYADLSGIGGEVTLSGTDNSSHKGSEFKFQSADDSNVVVNVDANGNITIGCYYV